jgi:S1-C subfamily serine protease
MESLKSFNYFQTPAGFAIKVDLIQQVLKVCAKEPEMNGRTFFLRVHTGAEIVEYGSAFSFGHAIQKKSDTPGEFQVLPDIDGLVVDPVHHTF